MIWLRIDMNQAIEMGPKAIVRILVVSPAFWVFVLTFTVLAIHPVPECVDCEYPNPWGRSDVAYGFGAGVLAAWLIVVSFAAGVWGPRRNWLVPVCIVAAHLATQPIGGVPFWSLWSNESPVILGLGLAVGLVSLAAGGLARAGVGRLLAIARVG